MRRQVPRYLPRLLRGIVRFFGGFGLVAFVLFLVRKVSEMTGEWLKGLADGIEGVY